MAASPTARNQEVAERKRGQHDSRVILLGRGHGGVPDGFDDETTYSLTSESLIWADLIREIGQ